MTSSAETGMPTVGTTSEMIEQGAVAPSGRRPSLFRQILSPKTSLHQSAISLVDQGVVSAANFLTGVIIARACSKEELGLYSLGFSLILMMADLQSSLIMTPYMVYAPRLKGRAHALYTGSTLLHQIGFCVLSMVGLVIGAIVVSHGVGPKGLGPVLWSLVIVITLIMLREHARRVSFARLQLTTALYFDTSIVVAQIAGLLVLAHFHLLSANSAYWIVGLASGLAVLGWLWWDRDFYEPRLKESLADLKRNWILGKWVLASGLLWAVGVNLYPWLLAAERGVGSTGIWAACLGVVSVGNPVLLGLQNLIGPKISHSYAAGGAKGLNRLVVKLAAVAAAPMALLCLAMFIWGGPLLTHLYGKQYAGNGWIVAILSLNILVTAIAFPLSRALFALNRANIDFIVNFTAVFIMLTAGLWLVRSFGPMGAAFGLLGANLVTSMVRAGVFLRLSARASKT
jgi:O-antigen/teichoic acid export membrane protein